MKVCAGFVAWDSCIERKGCQEKGLQGGSLVYIGNGIRDCDGETLEGHKKDLPRRSGFGMWRYERSGNCENKKSRRTWFARATAVARRLVPANFASCCGKPTGADQLQYVLE
jgi:hypothetical protein